jgi:hypothetical protein
MLMETIEGKTVQASLDFDKVCAYEHDHPGWSIIDEMRALDGCVRFTSLDLLASFVYDGGWKAWRRDGFTIEDLAKVLVDGLEELGFTSQDAPSAD